MSQLHQTTSLGHLTPTKVPQFDRKVLTFSADLPSKESGTDGGFGLPLSNNNGRAFNYSDFTIEELISSGKYGKVHKAIYKETNRKVALKAIDLADMSQKQLAREIEIHGNVRHPNIVEMLGCFFTKERVYLVLELAEQGSVFESLLNQGHMDEASVRRVIIDLAKALFHLHSHGIIHRDIKPENILVGNDGEAKLADFGWSILSKYSRCKTLCGTLDYLAPEMLKGIKYDHKVDIWGLGVLTYELLCGAPPFMSDSFRYTAEKIKKVNFEFPAYPPISKTAKSFISQILVSDPSLRPSLKEIVSHPFCNL